LEGIGFGTITHKMIPSKIHESENATLSAPDFLKIAKKFVAKQPGTVVPISHAADCHHQKNEESDNDIMNARMDADFVAKECMDENHYQ